MKILEEEEILDMMFFVLPKSYLWVFFLVFDTKENLNMSALQKKNVCRLNLAVNPKVNIFAIFKASALWADAFYESKCPSVHSETTLPDGLETSGWRAYR